MPEPVSQLPLPLRLSPQAVFESFWPERNADTVAFLEALAKNGESCGVALWGDLGVGKSHLLQAVCARAAAAERRVMYLEVETLRAVGPDIFSGFDGMDVVAVDDLDQLVGDTTWERALFRAHNDILGSRGVLLFSTSQPPAGLDVNLRDLASRLQGATIFQLHATNDPGDLCQALLFRAAWRGIELPEASARFLVTRERRNLSELCGQLDRLESLAMETGRRLTLPFLRSELEPSDESH